MTLQKISCHMQFHDDMTLYFLSSSNLHNQTPGPVTEGSLEKRFFPRHYTNKVNDKKAGDQWLNRELHVKWHFCGDLEDYSLGKSM